MLLKIARAQTRLARPAVFHLLVLKLFWFLRFLYWSSELKFLFILNKLNHLGEISMEFFFEWQQFWISELEFDFWISAKRIWFLKIVISEHLKSRKIITLKLNIYFGMQNENIRASRNSKRKPKSKERSLETKLIENGIHVVISFKVHLVGFVRGMREMANSDKFMNMHIILMTYCIHTDDRATIIGKPSKWVQRERVIGMYQEIAVKLRACSK